MTNAPRIESILRASLIGSRDADGPALCDAIVVALNAREREATRAAALAVRHDSAAWEQMVNSLCEEGWGERDQVWALAESVMHSLIEGDPGSAAAKLPEHAAMPLRARSLMSCAAANRRPSIVATAPPGYRLLRPLGQGAFGVVYLARDADDQPCALKLARVASAEHASRLVREVEAMERFDHPNLVRYLDSGTWAPHGADGSQAAGVDSQASARAQTGDWFYIAMEYGGALTLADLLAQGRLVTEAALHIGEQVLAGLAVLHEAGVVHRDLKPANILIDDDPARLHVRLTDFGLVRGLLNAEGEPDPTLTATHALVGTPAYMSPEQVEGDPATTASDVWSFGVILYEMLNGSPLFQARTVMALGGQILTEPVEPKLAVMPDEFRTVLAELLKRRDRTITSAGSASRLFNAAATTWWAHQRENELWSLAQASDSAEGYDRYLSRSDLRLHAAEAHARARAIADDAAWKRACEADSVQAYREYLDGRHTLKAEAARRRVEEIEEAAAWTNASAVDTIDAYRGYLRAFDNPAHKGPARERLAALEDESAWTSAQIADTTAAYREYLSRQGARAHEREAAARIDEKLASRPYYGLRIVGDRIQAVDKNAPAYGRVFAGDRVVAVNGVAPWTSIDTPAPTAPNERVSDPEVELILAIGRHKLAQQSAPATSAHDSAVGWEPGSVPALLAADDTAELVVERYWYMRTITLRAARRAEPDWRTRTPTATTAALLAPMLPFLGVAVGLGLCFRDVLAGIVALVASWGVPLTLLTVSRYLETRRADSVRVHRSLLQGLTYSNVDGEGKRYGCAWAVWVCIMGLAFCSNLLAAIGNAARMP